MVMNIIILVILVMYIMASSHCGDLIHLKLDKIMATQEQFNQVITRIDEATNNIAADLRSLKDVIAGAGLPASVEDEVLARLDSAATKLEEVAAETEDEEPEPPTA